MSSITYNFKGKVVLITGSSSGIGAKAAILFAKSGANVVISGRNESKLKRVAEDCLKISPNNCEPLQVLADVNNEDNLKMLVDSAIKRFGQMDILVNNAGFMIVKAITDPDYMDSVKSLFQTNLKSAVYLTHLCVEHLAKTKGNIINISSIAGKVVVDNSSAYCMSKCALDMFTKCMAAELGQMRIRVNGINPGYTKTDIMEGMGVDRKTSDALFDTYGKLFPVGRAGECDDIGKAILYLASEEASFLTGTVMLADGGQIAANVSIGKEQYIV